MLMDNFALCEDQKQLACLDISISQCHKIQKKLAGKCMAILPDPIPEAMLESEDNAFSHCAESVMAEYQSDKAQVARCVQESEQADELGNEQFDFESEYHEGMSEQELIALAKKRQLMQQAETAKMMDAMSQAAEKTRDSITLPLYPKAKIMANYQDGMEIDGTQSLPTAMLTVQATKKEVMAFYQKQLPNFKLVKVGYSAVVSTTILAEKQAKSNHYPKDYAKIPHIMLTELWGADAGKVIIQLSYRK